MALTIAIPKETAKDEKRVAVSPDSVKKLIALGCKVIIESGAGDSASLSDKVFNEAGATVSKTFDTAIKSADIVLCVQPPALSGLKKGTLVIGMLSPYEEGNAEKYAKSGVRAFAMELVPRITRAQSMDVLSSQSNLAGYKAVLDAAEHYGRAFPMMMTAAGTVPPAKVMVMGAGVAGLQAIATAKRLGAVVSATDVRPAAKEQVESLGASFVAVEDEEFKEAETAGGYAKEMSAAYKKKQQALIEETITKQDIVITTALIPGREAPKLVTDKMVKSMKAGSVIVDLAAAAGGNCASTKPGKVSTSSGVTVVGYTNVPSRLAESSSILYAKNLLTLLQTIIKDGKLEIDEEDEVIQGIMVCKDGSVVHPNLKPKSTPKKKAPAKAKETKETEDE